MTSDPVIINGVTIERDSIPKFLGLDGKLIPRRFIQNTEILDNMDMLRGDRCGELLMYVSGERSFTLVTDSPHRFLSTPFQKWTKV